VARRADEAAAHEVRAAALWKLGRAEETLAALAEVVRLAPGRAIAWSHQGAILHSLGRTDEALDCLARAIALQPDLIEPHLSTAAILDLQARHEDSAKAWARVVALRPAEVQPRHHLAIALGRCGRPLDELAAYDGALALDPDNVRLRRNRGLCLLKLGRYAEGWPEFDMRRRQPGATFTPTRGDPWSGEAPGPGRARLLVFHEEGAGDAIQVSRFLIDLVARGFDVTLWAPPALIPLLQSLRGGEAIRVVAEAPDDVDLWCGMLSLPHVLGVRLEDLPMHTAYLAADPPRAEGFEARLGPRRRPRIGLAWSGRPTNETDTIRSIAFERLAPLLAFDADWHALQNEIQPRDQGAFAASGRVAFHGEALADFADAAALASRMDLVISVDTSLAHLAGALVKPVWILLPHSADWRWLTDRADSPWYPTARLFRQSRRGDWDGVLARVVEALPGAFLPLQGGGGPGEDRSS
jgi:tetratricopeptide (TPR) repeat protein